MKLACREISWDIIRDPTISHEIGGFSYGYDMGEKWVMIKVSGIILSNNTDKETFIKKFNDWLDSGPIDLKIQRNSSVAYEKLDGDHTTVPVFSSKGLSGIKKIAKENGVVYEVGKVMFEQAGSLSA
jgi:hypothetical protein